MQMLTYEIKWENLAKTAHPVVVRESAPITTPPLNSTAMIVV